MHVGVDASEQANRALSTGVKELFLCVSAAHCVDYRGSITIPFVVGNEDPSSPSYQYPLFYVPRVLFSV